MRASGVSWYASFASLGQFANKGFLLREESTPVFALIPVPKSENPKPYSIKDNLKSMGPEALHPKP